jgi:hypothetical protein
MAPTRRYKKSKKRKKTKRRKKRRQGGGKSRLNKMKRKLKQLRRKIKKTRKQRGGGLLNPSAFKCNYSNNIGEVFTKIPNNTNPFLPDPIHKNTNSRTPRLLKKLQNGGHKESAASSGNGGTSGGLMDTFGLSDVLLGWYKGTNAINNLPLRYRGAKQLMPADPMHQPGLTSPGYDKTTSNIPLFYDKASSVAAGFTI